MISEAIVDCYNESEQAVGLFTMVEERISASRFNHRAWHPGQCPETSNSMTRGGDCCRLYQRSREAEDPLIAEDNSRAADVSVHPWNGEPECGSPPA